MLDLLLLTLLAGGGLHLIYLYFVRPVLIRRIQFRVYALRDQLRMAAIKKELPENETGYRLLEQHLNALTRGVVSLDLTMLIQIRDREGAFEAKRDIEILQNAHPVIRKVFIDCKMAIIGAIILNSPFIVGALGCLFVLALFTRTARLFADRLLVRIWQVAGRASGEPSFC